VGDVNADLRRLLADRGGLATWAEACAETRRDAVEWASRRGQVVRPYPGVIADPRCGDVRLPGALVAAGPESALSHTTALAVWRLPVPAADEVHVMTASNRRVRLPGLVGHRRAGFVAAPPTVVIRDGLRVTNLETSLVDGWPLLDGDERRAPLIMAVNDRRTTPSRVRAVLEQRTNLFGSRTMAALLGLLEAGCRSELELFGHCDVFTGPGFEGLQWQVPVKVRDKSFVLDAYDPVSGTNFELDGRKYHDSRSDRERDLRRDALLSSCGIHPIRFTHKRLHAEVAEVRREALGTIEVRRGLGRLVNGIVIGNPLGRRG
jgi:hypothetical protein